jgi:SAM-dependent methyltransferase
MLLTFKGRSWAYCDNCNFSFVHPMPTEGELDKYYSSSYWEVRNGDELNKIINSVDNLERPLEQLNFINLSGIHVVGSMLDFGSGMCGASVIFNRENFCKNITILDKSVQASEIADLLKINKVSSMRKIDNQEFEFIYSSHSLEHVCNLTETLDEFNRVLKDNGYLFIEVPNIANRSVLNSEHHAPHTYCFSKKSLRLSGEKHGFKLINYEECGSPILKQSQEENGPVDCKDSIRMLFNKSNDHLLTIK